MSTAAPKTSTTTEQKTAAKPATPTSPTPRRTSFGGGNDGEGSPMYKSLQKRRSSLEHTYADQFRSPLYEKFKAFVKGAPPPEK